MHDKNGNPVVVGQTAIIRFKVVGTVGDGDFCNCKLESIEPMPGNGVKLVESAVNTKQIEVLPESEDFGGVLSGVFRDLDGLILAEIDLAKDIPAHVSDAIAHLHSVLKDHFGGK